MNSEEAIHIGDFLQFVRKRVKKYFSISVLCGMSSMALLSVVEPKYLLQASFKEALIRSDSSSTAMLKTLLKTPSTTDSGSQALSVMKSRQLVQKVVEDLHLQAEVVPGTLVQRIYAKVARRYALPMQSKASLCRCKKILYSGKETKRFYIHSYGYGKIEVVSLQTERVLRRQGNGVYTEDGVEFSLYIDPEFRNTQETALLRIYPMQGVLDRMMGRLKVKPRREDPSVLDLAYTDVDASRGVSVINAVMQQYKLYLLQDNERIATAQMQYLQKRQEEISAKLDAILHQHVDYLQNNLGQEGLMGLHQELEMLEGRKKKHEQRILEIDFDLSKIRQMQAQKFFTLDGLGSEGKKLQEELLGLQQQKESLDVTHMKRGSFVAKRNQAKQIHHTHLRQKPFSELVPLWREQGAIIEEEQRASTQVPLFDEKRFALQQERVLHGQEEKIIARDFAGIDLSMAKAMHLDYRKQLDELLLKKEELHLAIDHKLYDDFAVSSLFHLAGEGIAKEVVQETARYKKNLQHEKYFSEKDRRRIQEHLTKNQKFLVDHFAQILRLTELKIQITMDNLQGLQQRMILLLDQQIELVEKQISTMLAQKQAALEEEREHNLNKVKEAHKELIGIPQKWFMENRLQLQSDLNIGMMEGMAQLVESKNIEHHLVQVESKPIDEAYEPLQPQKLSLIAGYLVGAFLGLVLFIGLEIGLRVIKGFPLSVAGLKYRGMYAIGPYPSIRGASLEKISEEQLEALRIISRFLVREEKSVVGLVINKKYNYCYLLAKLLSLSNRKILVIDCDFSKKEGVIQHLTGKAKELMLHTIDGIDTLYLGYTQSYELEILHGSGWKEMLQMLQTQYDTILLVTTTTVEKAYHLISSSQQMVITLDEENLDALYPYLKQEREKKHPFALYVALT